MFGGIPLVEIDELYEYWNAFPNLKNSLFTKSDIPYVNLAVEDIKAAVKKHNDVVGFENEFINKFSDFSSYLKSLLIENMSTVEISKTEDIISNDIFARLASIPLIDKYEAYQLLDNDWGKIAIDLEIIQTEGFEATKKVDPNLVIKKKDGKEQEIQEGWIGHIIPFELVQKEMLSEYYIALKEKENRLAEIPSCYEEIIESLTEEEKETEVLNDNNDAFVSKGVTKKLKELRNEAQVEEVISFKNKLKQYEVLAKEEKELKAKIKDETKRLHILTKDTIEGLSDEQVFELLEKKWVLSLVNNLNRLPDTIVDNLVSKIQALHDKYATTLYEIESQIKETEQVLCSMIDDLVGNEFDMKGLSEFKSLLLGD